MDTDEILLETEESMEKSLEFMQHEFASVRTGKASPSLVENIDVEAYGSTMKMKAVALISAPEPRLLVIQPFDLGTVKDIERALRESRLGINPAVDGKIIRIPLPELSQERRLELAKTVKQMAEETKVRLRGVRRDSIDSLRKAQKAGEITEDLLHDNEGQVQKLTDKFVKAVDEGLAAKEAEILKV